jgi:formylglycine-generating enzyme required for sulfatase activity
MPPEDRLPDDLKDLAFREGFELSHAHWHSDVKEMMQRLGLGAAHVSRADAQSEQATRRTESRQRATKAGGTQSGSGDGPAWLTRRRALSAAAKPSLRSVTFDFATVDEKGKRLPTERASAFVFREMVTSAISVDMIAIPGGTFLMGSPLYEPERRSNEGPQHPVNLKPFLIGAWPITQAQWAAVVTARPAKLSHSLDPFPSFFKGSDLPVESVSWNQAEEFCRRLAELTGRDYRLPSEAEWEYACRAGSTGPFNVGPTITAELANYCGTGGAVCGDSDGNSVASNFYDGAAYGSGAYDEGPVGTFRGTTTTPGTFPPNRFGLYDMHGNVWEYCLDAASPNYADAPTDGSAYLSERGDKILRGGSWSHNPAICRSAYRDTISADNPGWQGRIGLRVVCTA